jgi:hypothetical protein
MWNYTSTRPYAFMAWCLKAQAQVYLTRVGTGLIVSSVSAAWKIADKFLRAQRIPLVDKKEEIKWCDSLLLWPHDLYPECITIFSSHSLDSADGMATGYELDGRGVGVRAPVRWRFFSSPRRPDRFWSSLNPYPVDTGSSFPGGKCSGEWSWPLTSKYRDQEYLDLYIHSPIRLHGVVLNQLSTGTTLLLPFARSADRSDRAV